MAQLIEESSYITIKFPLTRGDEETVRSINLPAPKELVGDIQTGFNSLITRFTTSRQYVEWLFQPTNWRDTDTAEEAWQCDLTQATYEIVNTTRTSGGYEPES